MRLEVRTAWSPDVDPPDEGLPVDVLDFEVGVQVSLGEIGESGGEVFSLTVCSPSALAEVEPDTFITCTLVLDRFDWNVIRTRIEKLLRHCQSCKDWTDVVVSLARFLRHDDAA